MPATAGRQLLEPIHKKTTISVFFSSKVYSDQVMPATYLFLWECYLFLPFKMHFCAEQFKGILLTFLKSVFFNTFCGQCQKLALEAKQNKTNPKTTTTNSHLTDHLREVVCCLGGGTETSVLTCLQ